MVRVVLAVPVEIIVNQEKAETVAMVARELTEVMGVMAHLD